MPLRLTKAGSFGGVVSEKSKRLSCYFKSAGRRGRDLGLTGVMKGSDMNLERQAISS